MPVIVFFKVVSTAKKRCSCDLAKIFFSYVMSIKDLIKAGKKTFLKSDLIFKN